MSPAKIKSDRQFFAVRTVRKCLKEGTGLLRDKLFSATLSPPSLDWSGHSPFELSISDLVVSNLAVLEEEKRTTTNV